MYPYQTALVPCECLQLGDSKKNRLACQVDVKPSKARYVSMSATPVGLVCGCSAATLAAVRPDSAKRVQPMPTATARP